MRGLYPDACLGKTAARTPISGYAPAMAHRGESLGGQLARFALLALIGLVSGPLETALILMFGVIGFVPGFGTVAIVGYAIGRSTSDLRTIRPQCVVYAAASAAPILAIGIWVFGPAWYVLLLSLLGAGVVFLVFFGLTMAFAVGTGERELTGRCLDCGYDLTGNESGVCSECGRELSWAERREAQLRMPPT